MRFYNQPHAFYCGVVLHARTMYLCVLDHGGAIVLHKEVPAEPGAFLEAIGPYRDGLVVACECLFCWYWLADLCQAENIAFVLGHALYMKAIHGGKAADDKIDSGKIAHLLRDYLNTVPHGPSRHISNVVSDDPFTPAGNCRLQHQFIVRIGDARTNPEPDGRQFSHVTKVVQQLLYFVRRQVQRRPQAGNQHARVEDQSRGH